MRRLVKYLIYLVILCLVGLAIYAQFAPPPAPQREIVVPVTPADG